MGRFENAEVFRDTERMCRENARLRAAIAASRKGQRLIVEGAAVGGVDLNRFEPVGPCAGLGIAGARCYLLFVRPLGFSGFLPA